MLEKSAALAVKDSEKEILLSSTPLDEIFRTPPQAKMIHIVVDTPCSSSSHYSPLLLPIRLSLTHLLCEPIPLRCCFHCTIFRPVCHSCLMVLPSPCVFPLIDIASALVEQSRAGDSIPTDFPWLAEVHSKIWNREDLRPQLFRKVEVTRAHYDQLQKRLNELHTDRDSQDYNSTNPDVLRAKLDLLQSPTPVEALSPEHPADDNDDLEGSSSLFPSILSFVDLSTLGLEQDVPTRVPLLFLLRQEYEVISNLIEKRPKNSGGSVIVSGQPGTGEFLASLSHRI
jgi:hypothetical protein